MNLTREQEQYLIKLGIKYLTEYAARFTEPTTLAEAVQRVPWNKGVKTGPRSKKKWSNEHRRNFLATMKRKREEKENGS